MTAKMKRREFITLLGSTAVAWPLAARGQQPKKVPRLCFLTFDPGTFQSRSARFEPFFHRLNELGYVDGQTITIDYLSAEGRNDRFAEIAAECLRFKADVIAVTTTPGALAAKQATQTIPIVMLPLGDPVGVGLVSSIARPEGNVTGTTVMTSELAAKRLELLKDAVPSMSRVLVLSY
jgi:putative ABC transport system substrate-binding protein